LTAPTAENELFFIQQQITAAPTSP